MRSSVARAQPCPTAFPLLCTQGGRSPLHWAAINGHSAAIAALLGVLTDTQKLIALAIADEVSGASVSGASEQVWRSPRALARTHHLRSRTAQGGNTPLHLAAFHGTGAACAALLAPLNDVEKLASLEATDQASAVRRRGGDGGALSGRAPSPLTAHVFRRTASNL